MRAVTLASLSIAALVILLLFGYTILWPIFHKDQTEQTQLPSQTSSKEERPTVTFVNPVLGEASAKLSIVEFGDYLCAFCATIESTLAKILNEYKGKVKLVWKDFPLTNIHPVSRRLAEAGRCAGEEGKFWQFRQAVFATQETILGEADILRLAGEIGLTSEFDTCYRNHKMEARVISDVEEGVSLGVDGAPYFFVGDERLSGAVGYERLKEAIEKQLTNDK